MADIEPVVVRNSDEDLEAFDAECREVGYEVAANALDDGDDVVVTETTVYVNPR